MLSQNNQFHEIIGKAKRRWFSSPQFDLILWLTDDPKDQIFDGFELCYDKQNKERSIVWRKSRGYQHMAVDTGESRPGKHKATPILVPDEIFDAKRVCAAFNAASGSLPQEVAAYVTRALGQYPSIS